MTHPILPPDVDPFISDPASERDMTPLIDPFHGEGMPASQYGIVNRRHTDGFDHVPSDDEWAIRPGEVAVDHESWVPVRKGATPDAHARPVDFDIRENQSRRAADRKDGVNWHVIGAIVALCVFWWIVIGLLVAVAKVIGFGALMAVMATWTVIAVYGIMVAAERALGESWIDAMTAPVAAPFVMISDWRDARRDAHRREMDR